MTQLDSGSMHTIEIECRDAQMGFGNFGEILIYSTVDRVHGKKKALLWAACAQPLARAPAIPCCSAAKWI